MVDRVLSLLLTWWGRGGSSTYISIFQTITFVDQLRDLQYELEEYSPGLSLRPSAVVANKIDLLQSKDTLDLLKERRFTPSNERIPTRIFSFKTVKRFNKLDLFKGFCIKVLEKSEKLKITSF